MNAAKLHETALHHAAKVRNAELVELLVEFGGNIYARDNRGKKPSDYTWSSSPAAKCLEYYESKRDKAPIPGIPPGNSVGSEGFLGLSRSLVAPLHPASDIPRIPEFPAASARLPGIPLELLPDTSSRWIFSFPLGLDPSIPVFPSFQLIHGAN